MEMQHDSGVTVTVNGKLIKMLGVQPKTPKFPVLIAVFLFVLASAGTFSKSLHSFCLRIRVRIPR